MERPETPEAVALVLLAMILERRCAAAGSYLSLRYGILQLYARCLRVARERPTLSHDLPRIIDTIH